MVKVTQKEWAEQIEKGLRKHELLIRKQSREKFSQIKQYIPLTLLIGIVTAVLYVYIFGWEWFLKGLFNGIMNATIVVTILALVAGKVR